MKEQRKKNEREIKKKDMNEWMSEWKKNAMKERKEERNKEVIFKRMELNRGTNEKIIKKNNINDEWIKGDWFGLVSLFNGISTFIGYLTPKLFS